MRKVRTNEPLRISAHTWNLVMQMLKDYVTDKAKTAKGFDFGNTSKVVLIKNQSGTDLPRYGILGISGSVFDPCADEIQFKNNIVLTGQTPSVSSHANGRFAVLAEPLADGKIGTAYPSGICTVKIDIKDESHRYADIADSVTDNLVSKASGPVSIIWSSPGTAVKWSIVKLGAGGSGGTYRAKCTESAPASDHIVCNLIKEDGSESVVGDEGYNVWVYCNITGSKTDLSKCIPRLSSGDYLTCSKLPFDNAGTVEYRYYCEDIFQSIDIDELTVSNGELATRLSECS